MRSKYKYNYILFSHQCPTKIDISLFIPEIRSPENLVSAPKVQPNGAIQLWSRTVPEPELLWGWTAAVCPWGPSASAMPGAETGKRFASSAELSISCGNTLWGGVMFGLCISLPKIKWIRLESDLWMLHKPGWRFVSEDLLMLVTFLRWWSFLSPHIWLLLCWVNSDTQHFKCDHAFCFNSSNWHCHCWVGTTHNSPRSSLGMTA